MKLSRLRYEEKYLTIQHFNQEKGWSVRRMCSKLNITRAAYYKWLNRKVPEAEKENTELSKIIMEYDDRFRHILGYRRMTAWINRLNHRHYNVKRIHRIMKAFNIHSVIRRKKKKYLYSAPENTAENILARDFYAKAPNQKWATDVTEFKWYEGTQVHKLYLSAILDLYDRSVVSWVISKRNDNKLVFDTFERAIMKNPEAKPLLHSDRGFQYTSRYFQMKLKLQGMEQSMSRVGHCIDNGPTEGFWGIIKTEMYYLNRFHDESTLRKAISQYIDFYNNVRMQERFGNRTPAQVRNEAMESDVAAQYPIAPNKRIEKYKSRYTA